jgi:hypothetical protein
MHRKRTFAGTLATAIAVALLPGALAQAAADSDVSGQWVGNSQLDGSRSVGKTTLVLGASATEDSSLRIEDRSTCTLKQGSYSAGANGDWSLSFKQAKGGDACERLAKGTFTLRSGSSPRALQFEVTYPGPDGGQNVRRGALARYP